MTCVDRENVFVPSIVSENPVKPPRAIGLTPILPVIADWGMVEIPDFARITKLPAPPRLTGTGLRGFEGALLREEFSFGKLMPVGVSSVVVQQLRQDPAKVRRTESLRWRMIDSCSFSPCEDSQSRAGILLLLAKEKSINGATRRNRTAHS